MQQQYLYLLRRYLHLLVKSTERKRRKSYYISIVKHQNFISNMSVLSFTSTFWKHNCIDLLVISFTLTILTWKNLSFTEKMHWNRRLAASDVFYMFTRSIKFFQFHYRTDVSKTWFIKYVVKMNGCFFH